MKPLKTSFLILLILLLSSCNIGDYKDTVRMIPKDSEIIFNININSFFKRWAISGKIDNFQEEPKIDKFFKIIEDLGLTAVFSNFPYKNINYREDLFPNLNPNFSIAFYKSGAILAKPLSGGSISPVMPFVIVFNINDREDIEEFLKKLNNEDPHQKDIYKGKDIFYSNKNCYFLNEDFLIVSNDINLLKSSLDCDSNMANSLLSDNNFTSFREKKMTSDSIGFFYINIPIMKNDFINSIPGARKLKWKDLTESVKYAGGTIDVTRSKLQINSYIVQKQPLKPFGQKFFSITSRQLKSSALFPEKQANLITLAEPAQTLPLIFALLEGLPVVDNIKAQIEDKSGISLDTVFNSLSEEIAFSFNNNGLEEVNNSLARSGNAAFKLKPNSMLNKLLTGSESLFSILPVSLTGGEVYRGINIIAIPGSNASYFRLKDFIIIGSGDKNTKSIIDTSMGDYTSIEKHIASEISPKGIAILYGNTNDLYNSHLNYVIIDESLKNKFKEIFEKYPEIWGNIDSINNGYYCKLIIPF